MWKRVRACSSVDFCMRMNIYIYISLELHMDIFFFEANLIVLCKCFLQGLTWWLSSHCLTRLSDLMSNTLNSFTYKIPLWFGSHNIDIHIVGNLKLSPNGGIYPLFNILRASTTTRIRNRIISYLVCRLSRN